MLLREADRQTGLTERVAEALEDKRRQKSCKHDLASLIRQRVYGVALGYEDLNDHETLRHDIAIQTAVGQDQELASSSTLCRFENKADRQSAWKIQEVLVEQFIDSFKTAPKELILDFDATDDPVHGEQEGRFFHGYYKHYCFLPLYVFCEKQLLVSYLRPSKIDGARHAWAILALLVRRIRKAFPDVRIIFRGDSGFCRHKMFDWCERNNVKYIVGIAQNSRLNLRIEERLQKAEEKLEKDNSTTRVFSEFQYSAKSWKCKRRIIAKIEVTHLGRNPRYVVTNLDGDPKRLYDRVYCARGDMENRISRWHNSYAFLQTARAVTIGGQTNSACYFQASPIPSSNHYAVWLSKIPNSQMPMPRQFD